MLKIGFNTFLCEILRVKKTVVISVTQKYQMISEHCVFVLILLLQDTILPQQALTT